MRKIVLVQLLLLIFGGLMAQQKPAYILYNSKGKKISYQKMIKQLVENEVVLFGEYHNNAIAHWLQLTVTRDCQAKKDLVLGAEMFEQDNQAALNNYLTGSLSANGLDSSARLWKNYFTDYAPLVNFAKENKLKFAATNIPRRYASMVAKGGFQALDTLTTKEKSWIAPLPIAYDANLPGYKNMVALMGGHGGENLPKAQAIKDATMAHFILANTTSNSLFIHYNGSYHSENYEGIYWYLKNQRSNIKIATITTVSQKDIKNLLAENRGRADYIICVDADMTNTY
jgi:uncharacterized iron-regulated protein